MAVVNNLETRICLVWKTERPFADRPRKSNEFSLLDSAWYLQIEMSMKREYSRKWYRYEISLRQATKYPNLKKRFRVTTFIEDQDDYSFPSIGCSIDVDSTEKVIWDFHADTVKQTKNNDYGEWRIVCLFHDVPSMLQTEFQTIHISTQRSTDFLPKPGQDCSNGSSDKCTQACLEFPSDLESLSLDLRNLLKHETLPDIKLRCGDRSASAHKTVLAARSEVFAAMFQSKMKESETGIIDVEDLDASVLDLFLKYLYSGKIHQDLNEDTVCTLYAVGDKYAVHSLKKTCSEWIIGCLTTENCLGFLILADAHSDDDFKDIVVNFAAERLQDFNRESWGKFKKEHPRLSVDVYDRRFAETLFNEV